MKRLLISLTVPLLCLTVGWELGRRAEKSLTEIYESGFVHVSVADMEKFNQVISDAQIALEKSEAVLRLVGISREYNAPFGLVEEIDLSLNCEPDRPEWMTVRFMVRLAKREGATFNPFAVGKRGELGVFQILPATAELNERGSSRFLHINEVACRVAVKHLMRLNRKYDYGKWLTRYRIADVVLTAWNRGDRYVDETLNSGLNLPLFYALSIYPRAQTVRN